MPPRSIGCGRRSGEHLRDDPLLPPYHRLKRTFGGNEVVLAVYADPELLSEDGKGIQRLGEISGQLIFQKKELMARTAHYPFCAR